jgi:hypothetical protein
MHSSKVYGRLAERLGLADHPAVLNVMLGKVAKNLCVYAASEHLVYLTLALFSVSTHTGNAPYLQMRRVAMVIAGS